MHELMARLEVIERKDKLMGIVLSAAIALVLFVVLLFWFARAGLVMGIEEPEWKTIGIIGPGGMDYGTDLNGRKDVNNFFAPSETPADQPPAANGIPEPSPSTSTAPPGGSAAPASSGVLTQNHTETSVTARSGSTQSTHPTLTEAKPTGDGKPTNTTPTGNTTGGGSDHGNSDKLGNHGDPKATVLNPNGLFAFGEGIGGTGGRMPLKTELSGYNVQLEEKIRFDITIDPSGDVIFVKAPFAIHQELVEIGKANIRKWKFSETDPGAGNLKTTVTISFRLK